MTIDPDLAGASQPAPPAQSAAMSHVPPLIQEVQANAPVRCPRCGSTQFFGGRRISGFGWVLIIAAMLNMIVSIPLMFIFIGFFTIFLSPILSLIGFYACRKFVNTCARCKCNY
jgi:hypothetical protein